MNIHKLNTERTTPEAGALAVGLNFHHEIYGFADTILKARAIRALENIAAKYPVYRHVRVASRRQLEELFDDLALHSGLSASRLAIASLLLEGPGVFINAECAAAAERTPLTAISSQFPRGRRVSIQSPEVHFHRLESLQVYFEPTGEIVPIATLGQCPDRLGQSAGPREGHVLNALRRRNPLGRP